MKYILEIEKENNFMVSAQEHDLNDEQVEYVKGQLALGRKVPLYSTTKAKAKYGDCIIGNIRNIK